jgi:5,10-methylenetetrahydromethanopterin reductase
MISGITINPDADIRVLKAAARLAEELGFTYLYVADQGLSRDVYITLTALASCTTRLRLGPGITHPYVRHPAATAVAVATLDELSDHRAFLGVGAGGTRALGPLNLPRTAPLAATQEMVEIARLLWKGGAVTYNGSRFQLKDARLGFPSRPDIEIHWAARGPKMLKLGGRLTDVIFLHGIPHAEIPRLIEVSRLGALEAQKHVRIHLAVAFVYDEPSMATARLRTAYRLVDLPEEARAKLGVPRGLVEEIARRVLRADLKAAAELVDDQVLRCFVVDVRHTASLEEWAHLIAPLGLEGIIAEIPDPNSYLAALPAAREAIDRLAESLSSVPTEKPHPQEVSHGTG